MKDDRNRNQQLHGPLPLLTVLPEVQVAGFPLLDWKGRGNKVVDS